MVNLPFGFSRYVPTYNPGLQDIELEEKKLRFLETKMKSLVPDHPLFKLKPYEDYKKWVEGKDQTAIPAGV